MKIKAIKAVNYKAFHDINLEIGGQNTVIFGINVNELGEKIISLRP